MTADPDIRTPLQTHWETVLDGIISLRGPKLTFRAHPYLWVVRAGASPRAWRIKVDHRGNAVGKWRERRPPLEDLVCQPETVAASRRELTEALRNKALAALGGGRGLTNGRMLRQRQSIRTVIKLRWLEQWLVHFPREALDFVCRHQFKHRQWHLLNLWLRVPQGRELFEAIPALAWMLASSWCYKLKPVQRPLRSIRALVTRPRRHLLRWLDLPEGAATLRLLKQFSGADMDLRIAHAMCRVFRQVEKRRWWLDLPHKADYRQLCILAYDQPISLELLRAINDEARPQAVDADRWLTTLYRRTVKLLREQFDDANYEKLRRIRSPLKLAHLHDELEGFAQQLLQRSGTFALEPPVEPPPWLRPIRNTFELLKEAAEMRHCAGSYENEIASGHCYFFAVHHPLARATLCIRPLNEGRWFPSQLNGVANSEVTDTVREAVRDWLTHATQRAGFGQEVRRLLTASDPFADSGRWEEIPPAAVREEPVRVKPIAPAAKFVPRRPEYHPDQLVFDFERLFVCDSQVLEDDYIPF